MIDFSNLLTLQFLLLCYMLIGWIARKLNIVSEEGKISITDLVISIVLPCNIIVSFYMDMDVKVLWSMGKIFVIGMLVQILQLFLSRVVYPHVKDFRRKKVLEYGTICSNAGFLGNTVVEGIYGAPGLLYGAVYLIPARLFLWTAGLACFTTFSI
ncbi:MAG: AEC family transporter, partial [Fusobacteriaceae bacterium]|nr:AEC family transporter [Fusobacteriaceae bacterium]